MESPIIEINPWEKITLRVINREVTEPKELIELPQEEYANEFLRLKMHEIDPQKLPDVRQISFYDLFKELYEQSNEVINKIKKYQESISYYSDSIKKLETSIKYGDTTLDILKVEDSISPTKYLVNSYKDKIKKLSSTDKEDSNFLKNLQERLDSEQKKMDTLQSILYDFNNGILYIDKIRDHDLLITKIDAQNLISNFKYKIEELEKLIYDLQKLEQPSLIEELEKNNIISQESGQYKINNILLKEFLENKIKLPYLSLTNNGITSLRHTEKNRLYRGMDIEYLLDYLDKGIEIHENSNLNAITQEPSIALGASPFCALFYSNQTIQTKSHRDHLVAPRENYSGFIVEVDAKKLDGLPHPVSTLQSYLFFTERVPRDTKYGLLREYYTSENVPPDAITTVYIKDTIFHDLDENLINTLKNDYEDKLIVWGTNINGLMESPYLTKFSKSKIENGLGFEDITELEEFSLYDAVSRRHMIKS
jgi:hypothetical protein